MLLPSRLSKSTLGDLLGALHRQGTTGSLELCEIWTPTGSTVPGRIHRIHLLAGLVTGVQTPIAVQRLGEILAHHGTVDDQWIQRIVALTATTGRPIGEALLAFGLVEETLLDRALRSQLRARLDRLFAIEDAKIGFHTARSTTRSPRKVGALWPSEFLHGRPRARDKGRGPTDPDPRRKFPYDREPGGYSTPPPSGRYETPRLRAFRMLGLTEGATEAEVRRAFRKLAAQLHPDIRLASNVMTQEQRTAQFAELSAAYHLLVA